MPDDTLVLRRVDHQIDWYDRHATTARIWYCGIKVAQIVLRTREPTLTPRAVSAPRSPP